MQKPILVVTFLFFLIPISYAQLSQQYLCNVTQTSSNISYLQNVVKNDTGVILSEGYLIQYIKYPESYCNTTKNHSFAPTIQQPQIIYQSEPKADNDVNSSAYTIVPTGISIDNLKYYDDRNAKGILKFMSVFFIMSPSDPYSKNPNYYISGVKLVPIFIVLLSLFLIYKFKKFKQNVDSHYLKNHD